jgi:hypothetical protein
MALGTLLLLVGVGTVVVFALTVFQDAANVAMVKRLFGGNPRFDPWEVAWMGVQAVAIAGASLWAAIVVFRSRNERYRSKAGRIALWIVALAYGVGVLGSILSMFDPSSMPGEVVAALADAVVGIVIAGGLYLISRRIAPPRADPDPDPTLGLEGLA